VSVGYGAMEATREAGAATVKANSFLEHDGGKNAATDAAMIATKAAEKAMKRFSWVPSSINSALLTVIGCLYCFVVVQESGFAFDKKTFCSTNNFSALICLWFAMFNATDLIFGSIFYPKQMDVMTAFVHHPLYIYIMYACTTGNYGVTLSGELASAAPFSGSFMLVCVEEFPTLILGLGTVVPALRSEWGFGSSFFILRIVYHGWVMLRGYQVGVHAIQMSLFGLTMVMHIIWFRGWVIRMISGGKKVAGKKPKEA